MFVQKCYTNVGVFLEKVSITFFTLKMIVQYITLHCFLVNLALDKNTSQSSTTNGGVSARAVDGDRNGSCTKSSAQDNPWFRVDLGKSYSIGRVSLVYYY